SQAKAASARAMPSMSASAAASASAKPSGETVAAFEDGKVGEPSASFEGVVGDWYVADENGGKALKVDGSKWQNGVPSASLADQAKHLYGERYAGFLHGGKAFAFFPFALFKGEPPKGDIAISGPLFPHAGDIDKGA